MLFHNVTSQLERVQSGEPAAVAHGVARLDAAPEPVPECGRPPAVRVVPVLPQPRAVLGLVAAEPAASLVHALEVRQHGRAVVGGEPAF